MKLVGFIKSNIALVGTSVVVGISAITIVIVLIMQSSNEEIIGILEAGADTVPIIKQEDLDVLGRTYSILNEQFEREINDLTTGEANRHNKMDKVLNHYGVYGKENTDPFKNDDYVNGIRISYDKTNANIPNGASNFNDIISVMSVLYEQKMDTKTIDELKETFTRLFWLSHTYTYDSDELYPCRHGCLAENNYKCTAVYNDYRDTRYLKYELFTVPYHEEYVDLGYDERENFRVVVPVHQCTVHGQRGAGCEWDESKTCYHGSGMKTFAECELKINTEPSDEESGGGGSDSENDAEGTSYGEVGDEVIPENIDEMYLEADPIKGQKISRTDTACRYYKIIKLCNTRKNLLTQIKNAKKTLKNAEKAEQRHSESCDYDGDGECGTCRSNAEAVERASARVGELEASLEEHISTVCEADEVSSKYWCDGYKLCMGHKDHYKCAGKHKVILCSGHTNINVEIKVMYNKELLDEALKVFN
ncbi:MAG: hypothetical protein J6M39_03355 [Lachnospiraceae bacterium]|nr:hypothetical protein [Lachnospiraceae bacterium]